MCNQTVAEDMRICKRVAESLADLRTSIARLSTKTLAATRKESVELEDLTKIFNLAAELAYTFERHLDDANHFWGQIDSLAKRGDA
jgi:hypothetical protein